MLKQKMLLCNKSKVSLMISSKLNRKNQHAWLNELEVVSITRFDNLDGSYNQNQQSDEIGQWVHQCYHFRCNILKNIPYIFNCILLYKWIKYNINLSVSLFLFKWIKQDNNLSVNISLQPGKSVLFSKWVTMATTRRSGHFTSLGMPKGNKK